jgi:hypothetical protein
MTQDEALREVILHGGAGTLGDWEPGDLVVMREEDLLAMLHCAIAGDFRPLYGTPNDPLAVPTPETVGGDELRSAVTVFLAPAPAPATVWVAMWEKSGDKAEVAVYATVAEAEAWRVQIARDGWHQHMDGKDMPDDDATAADEFWEEQGDFSPGEWFSVEEHPVAVPAPDTMAIALVAQIARMETWAERCASYAEEGDNPEDWNPDDVEMSLEYLEGQQRALDRLIALARA